MQPLTPEQLAKEQDAKIFYDQWLEIFKLALQGTASVIRQGAAIVEDADQIAWNAVAKMRDRKP